MSHTHTHTTTVVDTHRHNNTTTTTTATQQHTPFATIISLQQTGELNEESIQSVSGAVGQRVEATPIADIYTSNMLSKKPINFIYLV